MLLCYLLMCFFRSEVLQKGFSGCMKDIEVSRIPYNLLSSSDYTGLTKGCSIEVRLSLFYQENKANKKTQMKR